MILVVFAILQISCLSQEVADNPAQTPTRSTSGVQCVSAPGGAREQLSLIDSSRVLVAERRVEGGAGIYALRVESFDEAPPRELGRFAPVPPVVVGAQALAVRRVPVTPGVELLTRTRGGGLRTTGQLVALDLSSGEERALSGPGHDVTSFVVQGDRVFYAAGFGLFEVPLQGGEAQQRERAVVEVLAATPDGGLIASVVGASSLVLARLGPEGKREELGAQGERAAVVKDSIYLQDLDGDPVLVADLASGSARTLPEYQPGDRLLAGDGWAALSRDREGGAELVPLGGVGEPLRVYGGRVRAMSRAGGDVAVLVEQDTNDNGQRDGLDEADLCHFGATQSELRVPSRRLPLLWSEAEAALLAKMKEMGLSVRQLKVVDGGAVVSLLLGGAGPESMGGLGDVARQIQENFPAEAGIYAVFEDSGRFGAIASIDGVEQLRAGIADALVWTRPGDLSLELLEFAVRPEGSGRSCRGKVKNLAARPAQLVVSCGPYGGSLFGFGWVDGPPAAYRASISSNAGGSATFSVMAEGPEGTLSPRFTADGQLVPALDVSANQRSEQLFRALSAIASPDHLALAEHVPANVGFGMMPSGSSVRALRSSSAWQSAAFELRAPPERAAEAAWRDILATRAVAELKKVKDPPELWLHAGPGLWVLDHGVFVPRQEPSLFGD